MSLFRPTVERIEGYVPGEQPQEFGWTKLNTNENPYPPSPHVVAAIEQAATGRLNVYPDPLARRFCESAANLFDLDPDWILPANGSDENLTILMRSFASEGDQVAFPYPSYTLYETLADIQGARWKRLTLNDNWSWHLEESRETVDASRLVLVPNTNSPSGNAWPHETIRQLVPARGVLTLDEAYGDFADDPHRAEILQTDVGRRIVITRTLSKSYSLAGIRFGFAIAHPDLIRGMRKVKDSYNCNTLSLAAATAAIEDQDWMKANADRIRSTRTRLTESLRALGFDVVESQANFVWATHPQNNHRSIYEGLKARRVLIRYMTFSMESGQLDGLRITIGTDEETDRCLDELRSVLQDL